MKNARQIRLTAHADHRRGSALVASLIVVAVLATLAAAGLTFSQALKREVEATRSEGRALYLAEAGVNESLAMLTTTIQTKAAPLTKIGTYTAPRKARSGAYWADISDNGDGTFTVLSTGRVSGSDRAIEATVRRLGGGAFDNAVFAGNSSGDPNYTMRFGGTGGQADQIIGKVFSGGDVEVTGNATVSGSIAAKGTITGSSGEEGITQPTPDLTSQAYETTADYDVASLFAAATYEADDAGGSAWQVPEANPAHIFRRNPSDRSSENSGTVKDDYYIEDPYVPVTSDSTQDGTDPYLVSLSGVSGTDKVFYIDGNLWIHNGPTYSFKFVNDNGEPVRVTFVVKGNVTFSDNIFYNDPAKDGVAFIAMKDPAEPDSGNIYFGDPGGGTLEYMDSFMYAENDFIDLHLDSSGSKNVEINGVMTAGNHVDIKRDFTKSDGTVEHSQLVVRFDDRIASGALGMPGLPSWSGKAGSYKIVAWREISIP